MSKPLRMTDRVKGEPYEGPEGNTETRMGFDDVEQVIEKLKEDVYKAVSEIAKEVVVPRQVNIYNIDIPVMHLMEIGSNTKEIVIEKPHINIELNI